MAAHVVRLKNDPQIYQRMVDNALYGYLTIVDQQESSDHEMDAASSWPRDHPVSRSNDFRIAKWRPTSPFRLMANELVGRLISLHDGFVTQNK